MSGWSPTCATPASPEYLDAGQLTWALWCPARASTGTRVSGVTALTVNTGGWSVDADVPGTVVGHLVGWNPVGDVTVWTIRQGSQRTVTWSYCKSWANNPATPGSPGSTCVSFTRALTADEARTLTLH